MAENRSVFTFKLFQLAHGNPGLKISTEACLFGAIASDFAFGKILDIGTGSGLIACMIAQKCPTSKIIGLEIDKEVADLAQKNFTGHPLSKILTIVQGDVKDFQSEELFDFIVCNPPFYSNHLANHNKSKHIAIHNDLLKPEDLAASIHQLLNVNGQAMVLYPPLSMHKFEKSLFEKELYINRLIEIRPNPTQAVLRQIAIISPIKSDKTISTIPIKNTSNEYSDEFKNLLQDYYLIFP